MLYGRHDEIKDLPRPHGFFVEQRGCLVEDPLNLTLGDTRGQLELALNKPSFAIALGNQVNSTIVVAEAGTAIINYISKILKVKADATFVNRSPVRPLEFCRKDRVNDISRCIGNCDFQVVAY